MLVSIVTPVYNRASVIAETIESVINQTYVDWELILVDDNSTDHSLDVIKSYVEKDSRIKLYNRTCTEKGAPVCRNIGIEKSSGKFLMFLDSDDLFIPSTLEFRVQQMCKNPELDFMVFPSAFFTRKISDAEYYWNQGDTRKDLDRFLLMDPVWCISGPIWKRSFIIENALKFNEKAATAQDWEFHLKALLKEPAYSKIEEGVDVFVRRNTGIETISSTHSTNNNALNRLKILQELGNLQEIKFDKSRNEKIVYSGIIESIRLLTSGRHVPVEFMDFLNLGVKNVGHEVLKSFNYLKTAAFLQRRGQVFYKIYHRLFYKVKFKENLFGYSKYRNPLKENELKKIAMELQVD
jgi:glycosyltransferase involved in cell wall biosynthesis